MGNNVGIFGRRFGRVGRGNKGGTFGKRLLGRVGQGSKVDRVVVGGRVVGRGNKVGRLGRRLGRVG